MQDLSRASAAFTLGRTVRAGTGIIIMRQFLGEMTQAIAQFVDGSIEYLNLADSVDQL